MEKGGDVHQGPGVGRRAGLCYSSEDPPTPPSLPFPLQSLPSPPAPSPLWTLMRSGLVGSNSGRLRIRRYRSMSRYSSTKETLRAQRSLNSS